MRSRPTASGRLPAIAATVLAVAACVVVGSVIAQDARGRGPGGASARGEIPGTRKLSKEQLAKAKVTIDQPIRPVEVVKGDHIASGISLRNRGGGVINLRGVP